jgi:hypothetical protein
MISVTISVIRIRHVSLPRWIWQVNCPAMKTYSWFSLNSVCKNILKDYAVSCSIRHVWRIVLLCGLWTSHSYGNLQSHSNVLHSIVDLYYREDILLLFVQMTYSDIKWVLNRIKRSKYCIAIKYWHFSHVFILNK